MPVTSLREIKILKSLSHPNIIQISEMAFERGDRQNKKRGHIYMVFPFLDHDLTGLVENPAVKLTQPQIKSYIKQVLEATAYLHRNKILHRDMKGSNILIDQKGNVKLADFGLARGYMPEKPDRDYTNCVVTRWYRPPELFFGETKYSAAIDMWGVG
jgi:serine/threonine protein kinase